MNFITESKLNFLSKGWELGVNSEAQITLLGAPGLQTTVGGAALWSLRAVQPLCFTKYKFPQETHSPSMALPLNFMIRYDLCPGN